MATRRSNPSRGRPGPAASRARADRAPSSGAEPSNGARAEAASPIRVLCVDDHAVLVEGLKAQFSLNDGIDVVGTLPTAERLVKEVDRLRPDVVLLDIEMPGPDAFETADRLHRMHPGVRVIVLSAHIRDSFISASFKAGAAAYFAKSDDLADIVGGLRAVMRSRAGSFILGPRVRERCRPVHARTAHRAGKAPVEPSPDAAPSPDDPPERPATLMESLTARETEVLRLIGKGLSRTRIAAQLCRSAKTIDCHQNRMMKKLGITGRADLIRFAIREGLAQA
jgi:DNA-binding NarL/FixJ family response regulator